MPNPWLAIDVRTDPAARAREVRRAWEGFVSGAGDITGDLRAPITDSWRRCAAAGVPWGGIPRLPVLGAAELDERWDEHPLRRVLPILRASLAAIAEESRHLIVVADAEGRLLSIEGHPQVRLRAEEMNFAEGALWSEATAGTNAVGTAIALDHAVQVFASEHFNERVQGWTCAAAPIHDPASGRLLGVIDLTGHYRTVHPHSLALASATAAAIETELRAQLRERDAELRERHLGRLLGPRAQSHVLVDRDGRVLLAQPREWLPASIAVPSGGGDVTLPDGSRAVAEPLGADGSFLLHVDERRGEHRAPTLALETLGRDRGLVSLAGRELQLTQRHTEILVLLVASRDGMTAEELALALYGADGRPATVRTELFRLRRLLGLWIAPEPYRLTLPVEADFLAVAALLREGRPDAAVRRYTAPMLPRSEAPGIVEARAELDVWVRSAVLATGDREMLWAWLQSRSGRDDQLAWRRFLAGIRFDDPRRAEAASRLAQLRDTLSDSG